MLELKKYLAAGEFHLSNLLLHNYRQIGFTDQEFLFFLQLVSYQEQGELFPDLQLIAEHMQVQQEELFQLLSQLLSKKLVKLDTCKTADGRTTDAYDLLPAYDRLTDYLTLIEVKNNQKIEGLDARTLYQQFEEEFQRPLSPIEMETLSSWLEEDQYKPELIQLALKEAVLNQVYSFKYIDRILLAWERKNIQTKAQVEQERRRRDAAMQTKKELVPEYNAQEYPDVPLYNWVHPDQED